MRPPPINQSSSPTVVVSHTRTSETSNFIPVVAAFYMRPPITWNSSPSVAAARTWVLEDKGLFSHTCQSSFRPAAAAFKKELSMSILSALQSSSKGNVFHSWTCKREEKRASSVTHTRQVFPLAASTLRKTQNNFVLSQTSAVSSDTGSRDLCLFPQQSKGVFKNADFCWQTKADLPDTDQKRHRRYISFNKFNVQSLQNILLSTAW